MNGIEALKMWNVDIDKKVLADFIKKLLGFVSLNSSLNNFILKTFFDLISDVS